MHEPLQSFKLAWHDKAHEPFEHTSPAAHDVPQAPQLSTSLFVSIQVPEQSVCPDGQSSTQTPSAHIWCALHVLLQAPQCAAFEVNSTQAPEHSVCPDVHRSSVLVAGGLQPKAKSTAMNGRNSSGFKSRRDRSVFTTSYLQPPKFLFASNVKASRSKNCGPSRSAGEFT